MDSLGLLRTAAGGMEEQRAALDAAAHAVAASEAAGPRGSGDVIVEMVRVLNASRAFEANVAIFQTGKQLAERTIALEQP